jgi:hypothetical protein
MRSLSPVILLPQAKAARESVGIVAAIGVRR